MAKRDFTKAQNDKFNLHFTNYNKRLIAMAIFAYIKKWQSNETGFLTVSLDKLYENFKRSKKFVKLSNFKKIANKLVYLGLLTTKRKGRLKFYGIAGHKSNKDIEIENENLENENKSLREELNKVKEELLLLKDKINKSEMGEVDNKKEVDKEEVIKIACEMMKELGIKEGSTPFNQVIESLYIKTEKAKLYKAGLINYIKKVIHNKVQNQEKFIHIIKRKNYIKNSSDIEISFGNYTSNNSKRFKRQFAEEKIRKAEELENALLGWYNI